MSRTFVKDRRFYLSVASLSYFPFHNPQALGTEQEMWQTISDSCYKDMIFDLCMPKVRGEVLVIGKCCAPNGVPATRLFVDMDIGPIYKRLVVTGNRYWKRGSAGDNLLVRAMGHDWESSAPEPFVEMDIGWKSAFGGPNYSDNPMGKGFLPPGEHPQWDRTSFLPNVERPDQMMSFPSDCLVPGGYGPLDITWPARMGKYGKKYGKQWEKERFPEPAVDMDPTFYNTAPEDQQLKNGYWKGDEGFVITHMHPDLPEIRSSLPAVRPRCFVLQKLGEKEQWNEIALTPETVWLFPNVQRGILVSRGIFEIETFYGVDVDTLLLAWELKDGKARSAEDYRNSVKLRQDDETSSDWMAREDDLSPPEGIPEEENIFEDDEESADFAQGQEDEHADKLLKKAANIIAAAGLNPEEYLRGITLPPPSPAPKLKKMSDIGKMQEWADREIEKAEQLIAKMNSQSRFAGVNTKEEAIKLVEEQIKESCKIHGQDYDAVMAAAAAPASKKSIFEKTKDMILKAKVETIDNPAKQKELDLALKRVEDAESQAAKDDDSDTQDMWRSASHYMDPPEKPTPERLNYLRNWVIEQHKLGKNLAKEDLSWIDLSGLSLQGANFKGAMMDSANLTGADLTGADMSECILARVDFSDSVLSDVNLSKSNLGKARLIRTELTRANLTESIVDFANFTLASLKDAVLKIEFAQESQFEDADLSGADLSECSFLKSNFNRAKFYGAKMARISLMECRLEEGYLANADLKEACFVEVNAKRANFHAALMKNANTHLNSKFQNCRFAHVQGESVNFSQTDLSGADFSHAVLLHAAFGESSLNRSIFNFSIARNSDFTDADLSDARFEGADLLQSSLQGTLLFRTSFVNAHLFAADLLNAQFEDTDLHGAITARTILEEQ